MPHFSAWEKSILDSHNRPLLLRLSTSINPFISVQYTSFHFPDSGDGSPLPSPSLSRISLSVVYTLWCVSWPGCHWLFFSSSKTLFHLCMVSYYHIDVFIFLVLVKTQMFLFWYVRYMWPFDLFPFLYFLQLPQLSMKWRALESVWDAQLC